MSPLLTAARAHSAGKAQHAGRAGELAPSENNPQPVPVGAGILNPQDSSSLREFSTDSKVPSVVKI